MSLYGEGSLKTVAKAPYYCATAVQKTDETVAKTLHNYDIGYRKTSKF
jgi:hypothetical protein